MSDVELSVEQLRARLDQSREQVRALERAELERDRGSDRTRLLVSNLPHKFFFKDTDSRFVSVNAAFAAEVRKKPIDLIGKSDLDLYPRELAEKYRRDDARIMESRQSATLIERHCIGNEERYVEVTKSPVIDDDGAVVGVMGLFADVTERKLAQDAVQKQSKLLADQAVELEQRNAELSRAYSELKNAEAQLIHSEKMAAIGQLIAGLAHEINNPAAFVLTNLTAIARDLEDILGYATKCRELEAAAQRFEPELARTVREARDELGFDEAAEEIKELLEATKGGMLRIRDLVVNLRAYSRMDKRGEFEIGNVNDGIVATLAVLQPMISKSIAVERELGDIPLVECNLSHVNQVMLNLIGNAVQAVGEQGSVRIVTERSGVGVLIRIQDDGPGIPAKVRSRVFDPFFTTKDVGEGTGLGLSISRKIVDAHNGWIDFTSMEGQGTLFRIWLPIQQPRKPDENGAAIVDDD